MSSMPASGPPTPAPESARYWEPGPARAHPPPTTFAACHAAHRKEPAVTATDERHAPLPPPERPRQAPQPRAHRRPGPRRRRRAMLKAIGFTDDDLSQPIIGVATTWIETMPCNINQRRLATFVKDGHPRGGRDADGVQHDRGERRRVDGHRGHEGVARVARGHRRLDRARRARPPVRRDRVPRRLRQDDPGRRDGARPPRHPGARPLQRHDLPGHVQGQARGRRHRVRGDRRVPGGQDHARRAVRGGERRLPRRRARAAASSRPTRWRRCSSSWASARRASTRSPPRTGARTRPRARPASW